MVSMMDVFCSLGSDYELQVEASKDAVFVHQQWLSTVVQMPTMQRAKEWGLASASPQRTYVRRLIDWAWKSPQVLAVVPEW
jgi:LmbE family N-acetylglucosaminyl deacetylase